MINLELFSCAGGMAAGFRAAGIHFDVAIDFEPDHCDSYERDLGHRPVCMDARRLLEEVRLASSPLARSIIEAGVDLLVADPPCSVADRPARVVEQDVAARAARPAPETA